MRVVVGLIAAAAAHAAYCSGRPENGTHNNYPIDSRAPRLVRTATNGQAYKAGADGFEFWLLHLYGTPYEQGFAQGSLMGPEVRAFVNATWEYFKQQLAIPGLPAWLEDLIEELGLELALDTFVDLTRNYTTPFIYDEMRGMADAAGFDVKELERIHMIGELTRGDCSLVGAWGTATSGGHVLGARALDWDTDGPMKDYPAVVVYHPANATYGLPWANVGFIGWVGSLTGVNAARQTIHEIGVSFPDDTTFGDQNLAGNPFIFLLRDILTFDSTVPASVQRITDATRTATLILAVGNGQAGVPDSERYRAFAYSGTKLSVYDDTNLEPTNTTGDTWHPRIPNVVYYGMDWLCPNYSRPLSEMLIAAHGSLTAETLVTDTFPRLQSGDLHIAVYDLTTGQMYVSFYAPTNGTVPWPNNAYDRAFASFDLDPLFAHAM